MEALQVTNMGRIRKIIKGLRNFASVIFAVVSYDCPLKEKYLLLFQKHKSKDD